jgi:hypothetical protein
MTSEPLTVAVTVSLSAQQAEAWAQFLKRVGYSDYRALAASEAETWAMLDAGNQIRQALATQGFAPR